MNMGLTTAAKFKNADGWNYYNCQTRLSTATKKDIMLNSSGKAFVLVNGNVPDKDYYSRRQYYSKAYREWVKNNLGEERFNNWLPTLEKSIK